MANGQIFVAWVKNNIPQLYNKNVDYTKNENIQNLLINLKGYYFKKSEEANRAYWDAECAAGDKTTKLQTFNTYYNLHYQDNDLKATIDDSVKDGTITELLGSLRFLDQTLFNFNL